MVRDNKPVEILGHEDKQNDAFVRQVDSIVVARQPELEYALNGKSATQADRPAATYESGGTWSNQGSFVSLRFSDESVFLSAHHAAKPLAYGEDLDARMRCERREGRRMDNEWAKREPPVVADLIIAFLTKGAILKEQT
jgi:hypothetical protein